MAVADPWHRLAPIAGQTPRAMASMNWLRLSIKPVFARLSGILNGIISLMNLSIAPTRNRIDFARQEEVLAQIFALQSQLAERDAKLIERDAELKRRELKIQQLTLELAHHKRIRFGCKSEALSPEQRDLFVESCDEDGAAIAAELEQQQKPADAPRPYKRSGRNPLPPNLPRIDHRHEPESCTCGQCGHDLVKIGEDISEQLDVEPARFFVHRHIRPQYACRRCETITAAPVPAAIIDGGLAAPGLHAWVLIQKYLDHLPLYRIEKISERHGVPIARSTLAQWVGQLGVSLQPVVDRLAELLLQGQVLHADETPVQQLEPGQGKTKRAYMWAYRSNDLEGAPRIVVFDYQTSRSGVHARNFLQEWRGHLMVDDYGGYKESFRQGVTELACLAHCRRKFFDLHAVGGHPVAAEVLRRIGELYAIESEIRGKRAEERQAVRHQKVLPLLASLEGWLREKQKTLSRHSELAKAFGYALNQWPALIRYAEDGWVEVDNNIAENALRLVSLGRKNWLFFGSDHGGERGASLYSLIGTCKLNGVDPERYLHYVLDVIADWPVNRVGALLPWRVTLPA